MKWRWKWAFDSTLSWQISREQQTWDIHQNSPNIRCFCTQPQRLQPFSCIWHRLSPLSLPQLSVVFPYGFPIFQSVFPIFKPRPKLKSQFIKCFNFWIYTPQMCTVLCSRIAVSISQIVDLWEYQHDKTSSHPPSPPLYFFGRKRSYSCF